MLHQYQLATALADVCFCVLVIFWGQHWTHVVKQEPGTEIAAQVGTLPARRAARQHAVRRVDETSLRDRPQRGNNCPRTRSDNARQAVRIFVPLFFFLNRFLEWGLRLE